LDARLRAGRSCVQLLESAALEQELFKLEAEQRSADWEVRHSQLRHTGELGGGHRLIVADEER
jgi:hypothetical protein